MKKIIVSILIALMVGMPTSSFAYDKQITTTTIEENGRYFNNNYGIGAERLEAVTNQEEKIILNELNYNKNEMTADEIKAILTKGSATVWNKTYNGVYNIKKSFSMSASLTASNTTRPYTKITIKNTGKKSATVVAYKGSVLGSNEIHSISVPAGKSKTMTISRKDIIKYEQMNGQGTIMTLSYTVSVYNTNGNKISFTAKGNRYY